ncbi:MAG: endolytic transglycosylase MltG [Thermoleophilaceae bacterium]
MPLLALGALTLMLVWCLASLFQPFAGDGEGRVQVVIPPGAGVGQIGDLLADKGVVSSAFFFKARARISGAGDELKAGEFTLRRDMSHASALAALADSPAADSVRVTIPEGRARREVREIVGDRLDGNYLALTRRSDELDPARYGAEGASDLEGFLFPATYEIKRGRPLADLVELQLEQFKREFAKVDLRAARRKNLTPYDVLTIASMVDREAQVPSERPIVASVIYNRLREGIPLGIDATIRFATNNWTRPLTESQLAIRSPYNTRTRKGLPPGPIGSPGLAAIRAAARPARTGFLFYVVKPGTCGEHAFSETDAEFQRNVERYNRERDRRGGRSPTNC